MSEKIVMQEKNMQQVSARQKVVKLVVRLALYLFLLVMPTRVYAVPCTLKPFLRYALRFYSVCFSLSRVTCHALSHVTLQVTNFFFFFFYRTNL